jgi:predicted dehydrogenase
MMGQTHLDVYAKRDDVRVVAVADSSPDRLAGNRSAQGNIDGQAQGGCDLSAARKYSDAYDLIADPEVDIVDLCVPTPLHRSLGEASILAGKHTLIEKPLGRTAKDAAALAQAAESAPVVSMPAMCMRFWPGWDWLRDVIHNGRFGTFKSLTLRRLTSLAPGPFYADGQANGGAVLDLHIHDTDFVYWCLGRPDAVSSAGYIGATGKIDHVHTTYRYTDGPMVIAEGGWSMQPGFGFEMQYLANFENATAKFDINAEHPLQLIEPGAESWAAVELPEAMGYTYEIDYFLTCIREGRPPQRVTLADAAASIAIVEAEVQSVGTGRPVTLK